MLKGVGFLFKGLPPRILYLLCLSVLCGFLWFLTEMSFVYIMQGFLAAVGLMDLTKVTIPNWLASSVVTSLVLLLIYGLLRGSLFALKSYISGLTQQSYIVYQRKYIMSSALNFLERLHAHDILSLFSDKVQNAGQVLLCSSLIVNNLVSVALFFIFGLYLAPLEFIISLGLAVIFISPIFFLTKRIQKHGRSVADLWTEINADLFRGIKNYFFLKIYNLNGMEAIALNNKIEESKAQYSQYLLLASFKKSYPITAGIFIIAITTYISKRNFDTSEADLLGFFYIFLRFSQSLAELGGYFSELNMNIPAFRDIVNWQEKHITDYVAIVENEYKNLKKIEMPKTSEGFTIEFRDLAFAYKDSPYLFSRLNLKLEAGQNLLIKGNSGAGKSTLILLLLGLLKPQHGGIFMNSFDVQTLRSDFLEAVGYVGPEPFIVAGTVRDNLIYGNSGFTFSDADLWEALRKAELEELVKSFERELDEELGEIAQISTGQKQRISLARAFLRKPKLLILDEATANLDQKTERQILNTLSELRSSTSTVIISHRNSFDEIADVHLQL